MQMMKVSEEELKEFGQQRSVVEENNEEENIMEQQIIKEYLEAETILSQTKNKLEQDNQ